MTLITSRRRFSSRPVSPGAERVTFHILSSLSKPDFVMERSVTWYSGNISRGFPLRGTLAEGVKTSRPVARGNVWRGGGRVSVRPPVFIPVLLCFVSLEKPPTSPRGAES